MMDDEFVHFALTCGDKCFGKYPDSLLGKMCPQCILLGRMGCAINCAYFECTMFIFRYSHWRLMKNLSQDVKHVILEFFENLGRNQTNLHDTVQMII